MDPSHVQRRHRSEADQTPKTAAAAAGGGESDSEEGTAKRQRTRSVVATVQTRVKQEDCSSSAAASRETIAQASLRAIHDMVGQPQVAPVAVARSRFDDDRIIRLRIAADPLTKLGNLSAARTTDEMYLTALSHLLFSQEISLELKPLVAGGLRDISTWGCTACYISPSGLRTDLIRRYGFTFEEAQVEADRIKSIQKEYAARFSESAKAAASRGGGGGGGEEEKESSAFCPKNVRVFIMSIRLEDGHAKGAQTVVKYEHIPDELRSALTRIEHATPLVNVASLTKLDSMAFLAILGFISCSGSLISDFISHNLNTVHNLYSAALRDVCAKSRAGGDDLIKADSFVGCMGRIRLPAYMYLANKTICKLLPS